MANLPENARTDSITAPEPLQRGRLSLVYEPVQDIARSVDDLRKSGVPLEKIVVVEESSQWPGELLFQTFGPEQVFYDRHKEYISRYSVLSQLVNLETFTSQLQGEGYAVVFASNTAHILKSYEGWSNPLHIEGYTLYPFQSFGLNRALEQPLYFFNWSPGSGKEAPLTEPVLTPTGWRTMGDLRPGDHVVGSDGNPTKVIAIHPQGVKPVFRVVMNDDTFARCGSEHLWNVRKYSTRRRGPTKSSPTRKPRIEEAEWKTLPTREIEASLLTDDHRWQLPVLPPVTFAPQLEPELDPYTLGVFLGDGCWPRQGTVSVSTDRWIIEFLGWEPWPSAERKKHKYHTACMVPGHVRSQIMRQGLALKRSFEKFIPQGFLTAEPHHRLALLQGLLDTDGSTTPGKSTVEFSTTSPALRDGVAELVRGLGGKATVSAGRITHYTGSTGEKADGRESWRVSISMVTPPFRLPRKLERWQAPTQYKPVKTIVDVIDEGIEEEQVCITVAAQDGLYVTRGYNITHNSHCSAAGAKVLFQRGQIEQVLAFTLSKLKENLRREFDRAGLDAVVNDGTRPKRLKGYEAEHQVYVMNYEKSWVDNEALTELTKNRPTLFVLDECHKVINDTGANKSRKAIDRLIVENRPYKPRVWPMSASVVGGNPLRYRDVFSIGKSTNPLGTKKDFVDSYASDVKTQEIATRSGGRFTVTHYEWDLPNLQEIRHRVADRTQAIRKTDPGVRDQFKGIQSLIQPIQMTGPERELTNIITERAREAYEERGENLAPYYRLLRYACNTPLAIARTQDEIGQEIAKDHPGLVKDAMCSKLEYLNEQLEGIRDAGDKVLVFLHWTNFGLHLISDKIAVPHVDHYGTGQTNKESQAVQDRFKNNPDITCFLTSDAGSHGLNMQCARHVIQYDPLYSYDDTVQRASRIDRADSHLDGLTNFIYCTEDSVEQRVVEIQEQRRVISEAVQGTVETIDTKNRASQSETQNLAWLIFGRD